MCTLHYSGSIVKLTLLLDSRNFPLLNTDSWSELKFILIFSVVFSRELRIPSSICKNGESILYSLNAVVVHCGKEINRGHYITLVRPSKHHDTWLCFDDEDGEFFKFNKTFVVSYICGLHWTYLNETYRSTINTCSFILNQS